MTNQQTELQSQYEEVKTQLEASSRAVQQASDAHMELLQEIVSKFSPIKVGDTVFLHWTSPEHRPANDQRLQVTSIAMLTWEYGQPVFSASGPILRKSGKPGVRRFGIRYTPSQAHGYQIKE